MSTALDGAFLITWGPAPICHSGKWPIIFTTRQFVSKTSKVYPTPCLVKKGIELAVEASANQTDYRLDRMSISVFCDEPNFWAGYILGYDSLQMPVDPNGNGYYAWETEDLRIPNTGKFEGVRKDIEKRDYTRFINVSKDGPFGNTYDPDFVSMWVHKLKDNKFISVRDPLDLYNDKKAQVCKDVEKEEGVCHIPAAPGRPPLKPGVLGPWYAVFCGNAPMSNEYKCLQLGKEADPSYPACKTTGDEITC